jgi:hypothetical protein
MACEDGEGQGRKECGAAGVSHVGGHQERQAIALSELVKNSACDLACSVEDELLAGVGDSGIKPVPLTFSRVSLGCQKMSRLRKFKMLYSYS